MQHLAARYAMQHLMFRLRSFCVKITVAFLLASVDDFSMEQILETPIVEPSPFPAVLDASPVVSSASKGGKARMQELTPAKRRALGRKAAAARWGKQLIAADAATAVNAPKTKAVRVPCRRGNCAEGDAPFVPLRVSRKQRKAFTKQERVFGIALTAAEKRLARAIEERARAAATWAVLSAEIPSLQRTIAALQNQQNPSAPMQGYEIGLPDGSLAGYPPNAAPFEYNLNTVVSGAPVPFVRPAPAPVQPQMAPAHPLAASRVGGGTVDVNLGDPNDDEDKFLNDSSVAAGAWH
jgi:hypothetical protein